MFYRVRIDFKEQKKLKNTEQKKKKGERMQDFILTYPSRVSSAEGINVHWQTMMTRQRKEREGGGEKNMT